MAALLLAAAAAALGAAFAMARPSMPSGAQTKDSVHFRVHYDPAEKSDAFVQRLLDYLEYGYSRLVAGAGGVPSAAMREPISDATATDPPPADADGLTDVYIKQLSAAGRSKSDPNDPYAHYVLLDRDLNEDRSQSVAVHEFFHVLQASYVNGPYRDDGTFNGLLTESTANWSMNHVGAYELPLVFPRFQRPLDCVYGDWRGEACGPGYDRWLFFTYLSERYGPTFVRDAWERLDALCPPRCDDYTGEEGQPHLESLEKTIAARSGGRDRLADRFRAFALAVWDPGAWQTTTVSRIYRDVGAPRARYSQLTAQSPDTGVHRATVDHLAARYRVIQVIDLSSQPENRVQVTLTAPAGISQPVLLVGDWQAGYHSAATRQVAMGSPIDSTGQSSTYRATVEVSGHDAVLIPMINEGRTDGLEFSWRAQLVSTDSQTGGRCPKGTSPSVKCRLDSRGRVVIRGTRRSEVLIGTRGKDRIAARGGRDVVKARGGRDVAKGGGGRDKVKGGGGRDKVKGQKGQDKLIGQKGGDLLVGGPGKDRLKARDNRRDRKLHCGGGRDKAVVDRGKDRRVKACEKVSRR